MIAIIGPTGSGKSLVGRFLVDSSDFSVVNFDSCQVYSGLPVLKAIPQNLDEHYLYSIISHNDFFNVFSWINNALDSIRLIRQKKRRPILVGGTGFYLKSLIEGIDCLPQCFLEFEEFVARLDFDDVKRLLLERDPKVLNVYFDERRLKKALVFILSHGRSILSAYGKYKQKFLDENCEVFALIPPRDILLKRIRDRLQSDFDFMVEEVRSFDVHNVKIIGFSEIKEFIDGKLSKESCLNLIEIQTRRYAKRQVTFIKNSLRISKFFSNHESLKDYLVRYL